MITAEITLSEGNLCGGHVEYCYIQIYRSRSIEILTRLGASCKYPVPTAAQATQRRHHRPGQYLLAPDVGTRPAGNSAPDHRACPHCHRFAPTPAESSRIVRRHRRMRSGRWSRCWCCTTLHLSGRGRAGLQAQAGRVVPVPCGRGGCPPLMHSGSCRRQCGSRLPPPAGAPRRRSACAPYLEAVAGEGSRQEEATHGRRRRVDDTEGGFVQQLS